MFHSKEEKEIRVRDLLEKKYCIRKIAKEVNVSFSTIIQVKRRIKDELEEPDFGINTLKPASTTDKSITTTTNKNEKVCIDVLTPRIEKIVNIKDLSKHSHGLMLLLENKSLVEVAIILDLKRDEVLGIFYDFLVLKNNKKIADILEKNKNNLRQFLNVFNHLDKIGIELKQLSRKLDLENEIENLKNKKEEMEVTVNQLDGDLFNLKELVSHYQNELKKLKKQIQFLSK